MSAVADITLNDGQSVPVAHVFNPTQVNPDLVAYHDKSSGVIAGYPSVTLGRRLPNRANGNYKATARIRVPVLETAATAASGFTPGPTLAYALSFNCDVVIPERATAAERADLYAYAKNLLANAVFGGLVEDMDLPY